jgi:uncharacterized membrane protein
VLAMFFVHPAVAWLSPEAKQGLYFESMRCISGMVAPTFLFLAGVSIAIIAHKAHHKGAVATAQKIRVTIRGLQIWLVGYAFHVESFLANGGHGSWARVLKVDILHCIGASLVVFPWIAWPKRKFNLAALICFFLIPFLSMVLFRLPIESWLPVGVSGYFKTNAPRTQFSFIPYSAWIAFGLFVGPLWLAYKNGRSDERRFWLGIIAAAVGLYAAGKGLERIYYHFDIGHLGTETPQTRGLPQVFWMKGAFVLGFLLVSRLTAPFLDKLKPDTLVLLGKTSLFAYCAHLIVIYDVLGRHLKHRLSESEHFLASSALSVAMLGLCLAWLRLKRRLYRRQRG